VIYIHCTAGRCPARPSGLGLCADSVTLSSRRHSLRELPPDAVATERRGIFNVCCVILMFHQPAATIMHCCTPEV